MNRGTECATDAPETTEETVSILLNCNRRTVQFVMLMPIMGA